MGRSTSAAWTRCIVRLLQAATLLALLAPAAALAQQATPGPAAPIRASDAPAPVTFPKDDGPHDVGIEWWYYTGHLFAPDGRLFGFEFVIFKARQQGVGGVASHFAIADNAAGQFHYAQKRTGLAGVVGKRAAMDLTVDDWTMLGQNGDDRLRASMPGDAGYAIDLQLTSRKPPALHDGDGYIAYGDGTASYYYSRTDLAVTGRLEAGGTTMPVTGTAWMDHQWGNFKTFETGGWDWFALDLNDDRQIMLYLIRNEQREVVLVDGSIVAPDGRLTVLGASDFTVRPLATWTSPTTDTTYPSGWLIDIPGERLRLTVAPTMPDQELDTRTSTGVVYWEGEATISGMAAGRPVAGLAYVELTGYAPVVAARGMATPEPRYALARASGRSAACCARWSAGPQSVVPPRLSACGRSGAASSAPTGVPA